MLQLLQVPTLWFHLLFLPLVLGENRRCYYSPIQEKGKKLELIVTECPTDEVCFKGDGRYGNYSALSARGCMPKRDCEQVHKLSYKGTIYSMSYDCCDGWYCNSCPGVTAGLLSTTLTLVSVAVVVGTL